MIFLIVKNVCKMPMTLVRFVITPHSTILFPLGYQSVFSVLSMTVYLVFLMTFVVNALQEFS